MSRPGETDTAEMVAAPIVGGDQSPPRSSVAAVDMAGLTDLALATPDWILRLDDELFMQEVMRRAKERWGKINTALTDHAQADPSVKGLGTTLTVAWSLGKNMVVAHIGDSRAYRSGLNLFAGGRAKSIIPLYQQ